MWAEGRAIYRGGDGAPGRSVVASLDVRGLTLAGGRDEEIALWSFGSLVRHPSPTALVIGRTGSAEQVEIDPQARPAFEQALKAVPVAGAKALSGGCLTMAAIAVTLVAALIALAIWGLSALAGALAPLVPREIATVLDDGAKASVLEAFGTDEARRCTAPYGNRALAALGERLALAGGADPRDVRLSVYRSAVPNAVALPGGSILLTDTLLRRTGTADALAGVIAHEIGHVHHRHGLKRMLHEGGLLVALSLLTGDASGITASSARLMLGAAYSREAEREADRFGVDALSAAGGDPRALGPFLRSLDDAPDRLGFLSTHPMSTEREAAILDRAADRLIGPGPLIGAADEAALRAICG